MVNQHIYFVFASPVTVPNTVLKIMSGQRPKTLRRTQVVPMLNMLDEEDSGRSDAENQENNCDWELSVSEEELSSEDEVENVPNLCATTHV